MPSSRRLKATSLIALLTVLVIFYVTRGESNTRNSPFYTRTVEVIKARQSTEARQDMLAEEKQRLQRVERVEREHKVAMAAGADGAEGPNPEPSSSLGSSNPYDQKPIVPGEGAKSVAGRKVMSDGRVVQSGKKDGDDGVAKVGNVEPQSTHAVVGEDEAAKKAQEKIETALNEILKKGPIIVFSKSYCPFSKKAKVRRSSCCIHVFSRLTLISAHLTRPIQHLTSTIRGRARPARTRSRASESAGEDDWAKNGTQRPHQRPKYWRWRRH
jgi:hypothetical protein